MTGRIVLAVLLLFGLSARADIVHLKDGTKLEGKLTRDSGGWVVTHANGKTTKVAEGDVSSIEKVSTLSPEELAMSKLSALRRAADAMTEPAQGVERFQQFIDQNKGTKAAAEAQADLKAWKDRAERKLVRVGSEWMTQEARADLQGKTALIAEEARDQIKQGRMREAEATVAKILAADPKNASGLYLQGVLLYKRGEIAQAKRAFEVVREQLPSHAATLNNLAVILWQQRQYIPAVLTYDKAMEAAPYTRVILDNVAEALYALPEDQRENDIPKNAAKRWIAQDEEVKKEMATQGLYRWGATFVTEAQMKEIKAAEARIKEKMELLKQDFEKLRTQIAAIDNRIDANDDTMRRISADRTAIRNGQVYQLPLPSIYYDLRRENQRLEQDRVVLVANLNAIPAKKRELEQQIPIPAYTGTQRLIEAEGTPLAVSKM